MDRYLRLVLAAGSDVIIDELCAALPTSVQEFRVGGWRTFKVPLDRRADASELARREGAGIECGVGGLTHWPPADAGSGRLTLLVTPEGPAVEEDGFVAEQQCPRCGG